VRSVITESSGSVRHEAELAALAASLIFSVGILAQGVGGRGG